MTNTETLAQICALRTTEKQAALTKFARMALMKYLLKLPRAARMAKIKTLPKGLRETVSYKLLGGDAAKATRSALGNDMAHGYPHVFNVTRNAQQLAKNAPRGVYQRSTLGALSHDIAREAETVAASRIAGQYGGSIPKTLAARPDLMHSELGGRWMKNFLHKNRQLTKNIPGLSRSGRADLKNAIRAHDTDAWSAIPYLRRAPGQRQWIQSSPAARNVYLADKMDAFGRTGFNRTIEMSKHYKQSPRELMQFVTDKNIPKYQDVISRYASPTTRPQLQGQLDEYGNLFKNFAKTQRAGPGFDVPMGPTWRPFHSGGGSGPSAPNINNFGLPSSIAGPGISKAAAEKRAALWDKLLRAGKLSQSAFSRILGRSSKGLRKFHDGPWQSPGPSDVGDMYNALKSLGSSGKSTSSGNSLVSIIRSGLVPQDPRPNLRRWGVYLDKADAYRRVKDFTRLGGRHGSRG